MRVRVFIFFLIINKFVFFIIWKCVACCKKKTRQLKRWLDMFNNCSDGHRLQKPANICFTKLANLYSLTFLFLTLISGWQSSTMQTMPEFTKENDKTNEQSNDLNQRSHQTVHRLMILFFFSRNDDDDPILLQQKTERKKHLHHQLWVRM